MARARRVEVAIVGGGPVGMLLAAELGAYGVDTVVIETREVTSDLPKAGTLHARVVQSLARRGHLDGPAEPVTGESVSRPFHFAGLPGLLLTAPATEPEPLLKRSQADLERQFEACARERGVLVLRAHRVVDVRQEPDRARVRAEGPSGTVQLDADFVVGADGSRGIVRELAGIASDTHPATVSVMMGLVRFTDPDAVLRGWRMTPRGWTITTPTPQGHSLLRTLDCTGPHPDRHAAVTLDELRRETSRIEGRDIPMADPLSLTRFSDFSRLARTYRSGRVLLAGDAAHTHFPVGGQGLGTGLLDAFNLAWKLAHTLRGTAGKDLLDTYDEERRPAGQRVVDNTRAQLALMRPDPALDPVRALLADMLAAGGGDAAYAAGLVSAQDTVQPARSARPSAWEGRFLDNTPVVTDSGPTDVIGLLRDGRPLLLLGGGDGDRYAHEARGWRHVLRTVRVTAPSGLPSDALLLRPDGYLAWAADGDGLAETLTVWFGEAR
ncbi:FAD-dependent monooxygenase [Streptomyces sp. NPDC002004]